MEQTTIITPSAKPAKSKAETASSKPAKNKRKKTRIIIGIVIFLLAIRVALPYVVLHYANQALTNMKGYNGHIQDIDLAIYRGAYKVKDIYLNKVDTVKNSETEFFKSKVIDLSIHWHALLHGKIVGELELTDPVLRFTKDKAEPAQVQKDTTSFRKLLDGFMPLKINRFEIVNGTIQYTDHNSKPPVNIEMNNTYILAENLTTEKGESFLPASVTASSNVYEGTFYLNMKLDPLASKPTFDMNAELKNTNLPKLNDFFKAYGNFDVNKGTFGLYTEVAARDNQFVGYVKPVIKDLTVIGKEDKNDEVLHKFWEGIVGTTATLITNQKHDQIATKVPMQGTLKNASTNLWYAIVDVLRNAFIQALQPSIDHEINIGSVSATNKPEEKKGFFKKLFKSDEKKDESETNKK
jgi:hypothetical protein